jgi:tetratricopeptide (TPR) repeat protein
MTSQIAKVFQVMLAMVMALYILLTWRQGWLWGEPIRFYEYTLQYGESARLHNNLAMAYSEEGRLKEAIGEYEKAVELADVYPQTHHNLGNAYRDLGEREKAIEEYQKAVVMSPRFMASYGSLVQLLINEERYEEALDYTEYVVEVESNMVEWWLVLGKIRWSMKDNLGAEEAWDRALYISGRAPQVVEMIGRIKAGER